MLEATGKVQISGDALNGTCERLAITLADDRLVLSNHAEMRIQKASTLVSDGNPGVFELKGETLNLRIGELESSKFQQASWRRPETASTKVAVAVPALSDAKKWSPYGKLVRAETKIGTIFVLEGSNGQVLLELVAGEGGSLERFVGQTISVYGTHERGAGGNAVLRVTHIALP